METQELKFKAGDIVKVLPYSWYDFFKRKDGAVWPKDIGIEGSRHFFSKEMSERCGDYLVITAVVDNGYKVRGTNVIWEDWMLESKTFNEVKKETEPNKITKSMETKEMTLAEAQELVRETKYIVWSEDESKVLQKKLFKIGCRWMDGSQEFYGTEQPFLLIDKHLFITFMRKDSYNAFAADSNQYKRTKDILIAKLKQDRPKPKFDQNTLEVYDKVLVRESQTQVWKAKFFHLKKGKHFYTIDDLNYSICIPFNDETKHLHGTREDEPDFYKQN